MTLGWIFDFIFSNLWILIFVFWFLAPLFRGSKERPQERRRSGLPGRPGQQFGRQPSQPERQPSRQFDQQPGRQFDRQPVRRIDQPNQPWEQQPWEQQRPADANPQRQASQPRRDREFGWPGKEEPNPFPFPFPFPMFPWEEEEWQWERKGTQKSPAGQAPAPSKAESTTVSDVEEWYPPHVVIAEKDGVNRQDNRKKQRQEEKRHSNLLQPDIRATQAVEQAREGAAIPLSHVPNLLPSANQALQGMIWAQILGPPKGLEVYRARRYNPYTPYTRRR